MDVTEYAKTSRKGVGRMKTLIQISDDLWKQLNRQKSPGETFEDVLRRLLKIEKEKNGKQEMG